jgi:hypothetical protein
MGIGRLLAILALGLVLAACGGCGGGSSDTGMNSTPPQVPSITQFPKVKGRSLAAVAADAKAGPVLAPSVGLLTPGTVRFGFGLFDRSRKQITEAPGALYFARSQSSPAHGPYLARWKSLAVKGHYESKTVATDPDAAKALYVADLPFKHSGKYLVLGLFRLDNRLVGAGTTVKVAKSTKVPAVGQPAPFMHTPTKASVGGDLSQIDTRDPHDDMHDVDYADALGKKPIVLVFATPALCKSRVCGPVVDIAEQVKHSRKKDDTVWIHQEIYNNNNLNDGYRPQFLKYHLPSEPWLFTINRKGKIAAEIEGAFSADELEKAVEAAQK